MGIKEAVNQRRLAKREFSRRVLALVQSGVPLPEAVETPEIDALATQLWTNRQAWHSLKMRQAHSVVQAETLPDGTRIYVSMSQRALFNSDDYLDPMYITAMQAQQTPAMKRYAIEQLRRKIRGMLNRFPLIRNEQKRLLISQLDAAFETLIRDAA